MGSENNSGCENLFSDFNDDSNSRSSVHDSLSQKDMFEDDRGNKSEKLEKSERLIRKPNFQSILPTPAVAVKEKIFVCIDNSADKDIGYSIEDVDVDSVASSPCSVRNEAIKVFITNKLYMASDTEIAIASIEPKKLKWLSQLTSDVQHLTKSLSESKSSFQGTSDSIDFMSIFSDIQSLVNISDHGVFKIVPPSFVVRVIFVYCNSYIEPKLNISDNAYLKFIMSPCCILDVLYLHEKPSDSNNVEKIFQSFGKIVSPASYLLESSRKPTKVFNLTSKLLAHPYQRVNQQLWNF